MRHLRQPNALLPALVSAVILAIALPTAASAAPIPAPAVTIVRPADYVTRTGTLDVNASIALAQPARSTTVRFRILSSKGTLVYQHTESRGTLSAGTHVVAFTRPASALGLREGKYRLEVRVEASGAAPATVTEPVLVIAEVKTPVTVAVVVRVRGTPIMGPDGKPDSDPATATVSRDAAVAAARLRSLRPDLPFTLAVAPVLLDDWRRVAQGYTLPGATEAVSLESTVPTEYRAASRALADAARGGLAFAGVPFAEPDIGGLDAMGASADLATHLSLGSRVASSTLGTDTPGAILDGGPLRGGMASAVEAQGVRWVAVPPETLPQSTGATPTPGAYELEGSRLVAIVTDVRASALLGDPATTGTDLVEHLYRRAASKKDRSHPIVAIVEVGDGASASVADVQARLATLRRVEWVRLVTLPEAAGRPSGSLRPTETLPALDAATAEHWRTIAEARSRALAFRAAAEPADGDARACERGILLAEDRMWTGALRATAAAYAADAERLAMSFLGRLSVTAPDVTLSGTSGKVRASIRNGSGKVLTLTLTSAPKDMRVLQAESVAVSAPPGESLVAIPVEVRGSLKGTLGLKLFAGTLEVASARSGVAAGFMDRLAVVGGVVLVLLVLLWYIRSRGHRAVAGLRDAAAARRARGSGRPKDAS